MRHPIRVTIEVGDQWVFASAVDWPGWCRRGKGAEAALQTLLAYADRYAPVAGPGFAPGELEVVEQVAGTKTTDFGAPDAKVASEDEPLSEAEAARLTELSNARGRPWTASSLTLPRRFARAHAAEGAIATPWPSTYVRRSAPTAGRSG